MAAETPSAAILIALRGRAGPDAATALGGRLFAEGVGLGDLVDAHAAALQQACAEEPGAAAELVATASELLRHLVAAYELELQRASDYHQAQRDLNELLRRQAVETIGVRDAELEAARDLAYTAIREKSMFLANMSHEIRTPLNAVVGLAGLLADAELDPESAAHVETIIGSADHLLALVSDVLDFAKVEEGRVTPDASAFSLARMVELALEMVGPAAREQGVGLSLQTAADVPAVVVGDEGRLRQVLVNLLSNAVKFSAGGRVTVEVDAAGADSLRFAVRDEGIGIPADRLPQLFEPFTQADATTTRRFGGTGLGLAISKRLVELMGGTITVDSVLGEGSCFAFTVAAPAGDQISRGPAAAPRLTGRRLLLVDGVEQERQRLAAVASTSGMAVVACASAAEAMSHIAGDVGFDVAAIDHDLPEVDGVTLARLIGADPHGEGLPLILLSAGPPAELAPERTLFAGIVAKPVRDAVLRERLSAALPSRVDAIAAPATRSLRILVAEDHPVNQKVIRVLLRKAGYGQVRLVGDGGAAVAALEEEPFDVVLMDIQMPVMDGVQATRAIQARLPEGQGRPRIIAVTAEAMPGDRERFLAAGLDDYLAKPVTRQTLAAILDRCVPVEGWTAPLPQAAAESALSLTPAVGGSQLRAAASALRRAADLGNATATRARARDVCSLLAQLGREEPAALRELRHAADAVLLEEGVIFASRAQRSVGSIAAELDA